MTLDELRGRMFIGVPEAAADVFECDERTLRRAISDGQVPAVKIGNKTLIPVPRLLAMLGAGMGAAGPSTGPAADDHPHDHPHDREVIDDHTPLRAI